MRQEYVVLMPCLADGAERAAGERVWLYPAQTTCLVAGGFIQPVPVAPADDLAEPLPAEKKGAKA